MARRSTHFYGDGCNAEHGAPCAHDSLDGIDQATGPEKVWKCCTCGRLLRYEMNDDGWTGRYVEVS